MFERQSQRGPTKYKLIFYTKTFLSGLLWPCQTIIPRVEINCLMKATFILTTNLGPSHWKGEYCVFHLQKIMIKNMPSLSCPINYKKENYIRDRSPGLCRDYWITLLQSTWCWLNCGLRRHCITLQNWLDYLICKTIWLQTQTRDYPAAVLGLGYSGLWGKLRRKFPRQSTSWCFTLKKKIHHTSIKA